MPPSSATAPADQPGARSGTGPRLTGAGGTNPARWPLAVPRRTGESLEGWIWRLGHRHGLTPRNTLRLLGCTVPPQRLARLDALLGEAGFDRLAEQLALPVDQFVPDPVHAALEAARTQYLVKFHDSHHSTGLGSRFCPKCLADDGTWQASWASPLHAICLQHHVLLATSCPDCDLIPFRQPVWLTATGRPTECGGFFDPVKTGHGRYRRRCRSDLRHAPTPGPVSNEMVTAQQIVLDLAVAAAARHSTPNPCCSLPTPPGMALEAILDLVHAQLGSWRYLTSAAEPPDLMARALQAAVFVTSQPTPTATRAAANRLGLLGPQDPQAPIGPTHLIRSRPHSRPLETSVLLALRGRLSIDADLHLRLGAPLPSYPGQLRHPNDHWHLHPDQGLAELPMSSIPALIWPETLAAAPTAARIGDALTIRAAATMALSKTASNRRWNLIAVDLGLPARLANPIRRYWRTLSSDPTAWYDYLSWINDLFVLLHHHQPPINYQTRRATAVSQLIMLSCARTALQNPHRPQPSGLGPISLARAFWPTFTEADPQLAPTWVTSPDPKAALRVRTIQRDPAALQPWLEAVQDHLAAVDSEAADGPLTWRPP